MTDKEVEEKAQQISFELKRNLDLARRLFKDIDNQYKLLILFEIMIVHDYVLQILTKTPIFRI